MKLRAPLVPAAILAVLLACSPAPDGGASPASDDPLRIAIEAPLLTLDPHLQNEFLSTSVLGNVYDGLVRFDSELRIRPAIAADWETPDIFTWRFHLRPGTTFHDGRPVTADDVVASLSRARHHPSSTVTAYLLGVESTVAEGDDVVVLTTSRPVPTLLNKLAFVSIVPTDAPEEIEEPIGTGPYRIEGADDERVLLEAVPSSWRGPAPENRVELVVAGRAEDRVDLLLAGDVDLVYGIATTEADPIEEDPGSHLVVTESLLVEYLELRITDPPLDNPLVRRAIEVALDRDALVRELSGGRGHPIGQLVTSHVVGHDPGIRPPDRNLDEARRLLAAAGYDEGIELVLEIGEGQPVGAIVSQLAEAGIRVEVEELPWNELYRRILAGELDFHLGGVYAESADASDVFDEIVHTRDPGRGYGRANATSYSNPEADRLIEAAGAELDPLLRRELLQETMRIVIADRAFLPLWVPAEIYGVRDTLDWAPRLDANLDLAAMERR